MTHRDTQEAHAAGECPCPLTEFVWDEGERATGQNERGAAVTIGGPDGWRPDELLALALEAEYFRALRAAAGDRGVEVLGYLSAATGERAPAGTHELLILKPCLVLPPDIDADAVASILRAALEGSPWLRALGSRVRLEPGSVIVERET